jgi:hypothetical protein
MMEEQEIKAELIKRKIIEGMVLTDIDYDFCDMNKQFFKNIKFVRTKRKQDETREK